MSQSTKSRRTTLLSNNPRAGGAAGSPEAAAYLEVARLVTAKLAPTGASARKPFPNIVYALDLTKPDSQAVLHDLAKRTDIASPDEAPLSILVPSFMVSELKTAFQIGFAIFLPFIVIDVVVASVLMSMGMFMLPPPMIALPFKILLFVLVDGWHLISRSLVAGFG